MRIKAGGWALLLLLCTGCGAAQEQKTELTMFAAASMTETLEQIAQNYQAVEPDVELVFNFDSSGTLKTQIEEDADCDLFLSAAQKQMDELEASKMILADSRTDLLENRVMLVVPEENPKGIDSFDELAERLRDGDILLAMGNSDVPVGQYTQKILRYYSLDEQTLASAGCITYGSNVKEVAAQVGEGSADAGIVYRTDAYRDGLNAVEQARAEQCGRAVYPIAVLKNAAHPEEAQEFLDYLTGEDAMKIFKAAGFEPVT